LFVRRLFDAKLLGFRVFFVGLHCSEYIKEHPRNQYGFGTRRLFQWQIDFEFFDILSLDTESISETGNRIVLGDEIGVYRIKHPNGRANDDVARLRHMRKVAPFVVSYFVSVQSRYCSAA